jgi:hypothetical protein
MGVGGFGYKIRGPAGVFTVEFSGLFTALRHIAEVIQPPERCLIISDSVGLIKAMLYRKIVHQTHSLVYECKLWHRQLYECNECKLWHSVLAQATVLEPVPERN